MDSIFNQLKRLYFLLLIIICSHFYSCAYFNTFYNAETSYEKALNIIEESPIFDEVEVSEQAKKLLAEAVENSRIVLDKYPDSKYVDDAVYIIAKSSFLRGEIAVAESYFIQLLRDFPESKFHSISEIWLIYTHLRMGMVDTARNEIESIQVNDSRGGEKLYLIYNILAEIAMFDGNIDNVYLHYENAAEYAPSRSKKISTYGKLVLIAETNKDKVKASDYLVALGDVAPEKIRVDAQMKWITYQRELGHYDEIISEIQRMLGMSEFTPEFMQLELELGKVYKGRGNFELAREIFGMMVEKYSKTDETAEAYYQLGSMTLMENFNLDLAREYLENSKVEKSSSFYGRESKELLNKITRYETLLDIYKEAINNADKEIELPADDTNYEDETPGEVDEDGIPDEKNGSDEYISDMDEDKILDETQDRDRDFGAGLDFDIGARLGNMDFASKMEEHTSRSVSISPDSVLFMIAEMLLYDFNHLERSLEKLQTLAEEFPESKFAAQSIYVLSYYQPNGDWRYQLETQYPHSDFLNQDSVMVDTSIKVQMEIKRDYAWLLAEKSFEESYREFRRLYDKEKDTLSAYISAYISDYYLNDLERAVEHYQAFADSFSGHSYFPQVENRLKIIKSDLSIEKTRSQQGIDYKNAVLYFQEKKDFDSTMILLDEILEGEHSNYVDAANRVKTVILDYNKLSEELHSYLFPTGEDSVHQMIAKPTPKIDSKKDSLIYLLAELFSHKLEFSDSALYYHKELVSTYRDSKYRPYSLMALKELEPSGEWGNILAIDYQDTTFTEDTTTQNSIYNKDVFQEDFISSQGDLIDLYNIYLDYFPEPIDSSLFNNDTTEMMGDTLSTHKEYVDSDFLIIDTTVAISDTIVIPNDSISKNKFMENVQTDTVYILDDPATFLPNSSMVLKNSPEQSITELPDILLADLELEADEDLSKEGFADSMWVEHIIRRGETLYSIAESILGSANYWPRIYGWNKELIGSDPHAIYPYQILQVQTAAIESDRLKKETITYSVIKGETLSEIASKIYHNPYAWTILVYDNYESIINPNKIYIDQKLIIRSDIQFIER